MKRPTSSHRRPARKRYYLVDKPTPIERDTFDWKPDEVVVGPVTVAVDYLPVTLPGRRPRAFLRGTRPRSNPKPEGRR
jgi:hypothetical protein